MAKLVPVPITWRSAVCDSDLPSVTRHVALTLSVYMSERGDSAFPGAARLARDTGLSERCVRQHLGVLTAAGWLELTKRGGGRKCANVYRAAVPKPCTVFPESESLNAEAENPAPDDTKTLHVVQPISPENSPVISPSTPAVRNGSPRAQIFNALVAIFGPATTRTASSFYQATVTELLAVRTTPDEVRRRGEIMLAKDWDDPTPKALLKHWDALGREPRQKIPKSLRAVARIAQREGHIDV